MDRNKVQEALKPITDGLFGKTENLIQILMSSLVREAPVLFPMVN